MNQFTIGVEEEYQLVDSATRALRPRGEPVLSEAAGHDVKPELHSSQVEIATEVCETLTELRAELARLRSEISAAAATQGCLVAAAGTHPFSHWGDQPITPRERYLSLEQDYEQIARETVCFGYHVHIGFVDNDVAMQTMERTLPYLWPVAALAANSPFWLETDTGYASFRTEIASRWPTAGLPEAFETRSEYDELVRTMVANRSIQDASQIYWDVRPSAHAATLEFRVADVCMSIDEGVMVAGLIRGVARTCHDEVVAGVPPRSVRRQVLEMARWRAARHGIDDDLIALDGLRVRPAAEVIGELIEYVKPALEESGDFDVVSAIAEQIFRSGNGAGRQRRAYRRAGQLEDVVDLVVRETATF